MFVFIPGIASYKNVYHWNKDVFTLITVFFIPLSSCLSCLFNGGLYTYWFIYVDHFRSLKEADESEEADYCCNCCSENFTTALELAYHSKSHNFSNMFKCPFCSYVTFLKGCIRHHVIRHEKNFPYVCTICNQGFVCRANLADHAERHSGVKRFHCEQCDKRFVFKRYLQEHVKFYHEKITPFCCEICDKVFSYKYSWLRHLSVIHGIGQKRRRVCKICNKVLTSAYGLKLHLRLHTGEKPFICEICGMKYSRHLYLNRHITMKHKKTK